MKYRMKTEVEAIQFDGTFSGLQYVDDWVSSHDIENCEATCQGTKEPLALDVTTAFGLSTAEAGDYIMLIGGVPTVIKEANFEATYEAAD